jgi:hypothetical protein
VYIDVESIPAGERFDLVLTDCLRQSAALVVVIGPHWLGDDATANRLLEKDDVVRWEIRKALELQLPILPVLVDGASMPRREQVPTDISDLLTRQAVSLRDATFRSDVRAILRFLSGAGVVRQKQAIRVALAASGYAVAQTASISTVLKMLGAPWVPWRDAFADAWPWSVVLACILGTTFYAVSGRTRLRVALWILLGSTVLAAVIVTRAFPAITIIKTVQPFADVDTICDNFETDNRLYRGIGGVHTQGPPIRGSFCPGEAFTEEHFEITVRTGWFYRRDLSMTLVATSLPASGTPPMHVSDVGIEKTLGVLPSFFDASGNVSTHSTGPTPPRFTVLVTCWYERIGTQPQQIGISMTLRVDAKGPVTRSGPPFDVDW